MYAVLSILYNLLQCSLEKQKRETQKISLLVKDPQDKPCEIKPVTGN